MLVLLFVYLEEQIKKRIISDKNTFWSNYYVHIINMHLEVTVLMTVQEILLSCFIVFKENRNMFICSLHYVYNNLLFLSVYL